MKHLGALFLALFLLPIFAAAEDLPKPITDFISSYNSYTEYYAVDPLPFDGWIDRGTYYGFLDGDAYFSVSIDNTICIASYIIPPQDANGDFFAVCACLSAAIRGESQDNYADILTAYFLFRTATPGERITHKSPGGYMFFQLDEDLFLFGVTK